MSVAVNKAAKAGVPSSTFATLLRRSKFASYDPSIGQLYTAHGGSAARGDYGLKRPLAIRKRGTRLAIHNIDTIYQQTEWSDAYSDNHFVRRFDELGFTPSTITPSTEGKKGGWERHFGGAVSDIQLPWLHDSDYVDKIPGKLETELYASQPTPNVNAMNEKRFKRFLRRVRKIQPEFDKFLADEEKIKQQVGSNMAPPSQQSSLPLYRSMNNPRDHLRFIANNFSNTTRTPDSTVLYPLPHPVAGITYINSSTLQTAVTTKPIPGRVLYEPDRKEHVFITAAGWVGISRLTTKEKRQTDAFKLTDFGFKDGEPRKNTEAGKSIFRVQSIRISSPPLVVGKHPSPIGKTSLNMTFDKQPESLMTYYPPGSKEYVGLPERVIKTTAAKVPIGGNQSLFLSKRTPSRPPIQPIKDEGPERNAKATDLLQKLKHMTVNKEVKEDGDL